MDITTFITPNSEFEPQSLPHSLCHFSTKDALHEAVHLTKFLQATIMAFGHADYDMGDSERMGLNQCFNLLRDKIEIGSGLYGFPQFGCTSKQKLCERTEV